MADEPRDRPQNFHQAGVSGNQSELTISSFFASLLQFSSEYERFNNGDFVKNTQALEKLARRLPEAIFRKEMLRYIDTGIGSDDLFARKAACILMAALASKPEDITTNIYWKPCVPFLMRALQDPNPDVLNAAFFAFEKFPGVWFWVEEGGFVNVVEPAILTCLASSCSTWLSENDVLLPFHFGNFLACVGTMCGKQLALEPPGFTEIFSFLLSIITGSYNMDFRELVLVKAIKLAVQQTELRGKANIALLLEEPLEVFVDSDFKLNEDSLTIQCVLLDVLKFLEAELSVSDYVEYFAPLARDSVLLIYNVIEEVDDPDEMESFYQFMRSLYEYEEVEEDIKTLTAQIVESNLATLRSEDLDEFSDSEELSEEEEDSDSEADFARCLKASSGAKEKACLHIKYMAEYLKLENLENCFSECLERLLETFHNLKGRARAAAIQALARVCYAVTGEDRQQVLMEIIPDFIEVALKDSDINCVLDALDAIDYLFENQYGICENSDLVDSLIEALSQLLLSKAEIQGIGDEFTRIRADINDSPDTVGHRIFSFCVENIIPNMLQEMNPAMAAKALELLFPLILSKTDTHCSVLNRKMAIRALGKVVGRLGDRGGDFLDKLIPALVLFCSSYDKEVRKNAFVALQNCVLRCRRAAVFTHYSEILSIQRKCLSDINNPNLTTACTIIAAMIVTTGGSMISGLDDVIPVILQTLDPSKYRHESLRVMMQCLGLLHSSGHALMKDLICLVFDFVVAIVSNRECQSEGKVEGVKLLVTLKAAYPEEYSTAIGKLSAGALEELEDNINA